MFCREWRVIIEKVQSGIRLSGIGLRSACRFCLQALTEVAVIGVYDFVRECILSIIVGPIGICAVTKAERDGKRHTYYNDDQEEDYPAGSTATIAIASIRTVLYVVWRQ